METPADRAIVAARYVAEATGLGSRIPAPSVGLILGSGLGPVAADVAVVARRSTAEIPGFARSTVSGHAGELLLGTLEGTGIAVLAGRVHGYEGYAPDQLGFGVRVLRALGCRTLVTTNAAGALNPAFRPGDIMVIEDHLSFPSLAGGGPLVGLPIAGLPRFVDLTDAYAPYLRELAHQAAARAGDRLRAGVYVMVGGPNFETPAEVRFLRQIGGDAVGMSTVPEVVVARQLGMSVLGLSAISNLAAGMPGARLAHEDVLATMARSAPIIARVVRGVVAGLPR
jgi:purine-nucleoside phosphorylase